LRSRRPEKIGDLWKEVLKKEDALRSRGHGGLNKRRSWS
jgi:hypothetical protein